MSYGRLRTFVLVSAFVLVATSFQPLFAAEQLVQLTIHGCSTPETQDEINRILGAVDGVLQVRADYKRHLALVAYDDEKTTLDALKAALEEKRYAVSHAESID